MATTPAVADGVLQIGLVVRDALAVAEQYKAILGVDGWCINEVDTERGKGSNFRYRGTKISTKARIAWTKLGNIELELIEPLDENSVYAEFLRDSGPGIHHVMFNCTGHESVCQQMIAAGIEELASGELQDTRFQLFDTRDALGLICEIAEGGSLRPDRELV